MILTVTPNPCIERTILAPDFTVGQSYRIAPRELQVNAGGKGINAARVAKQFSQACALAWTGRHQRSWFEAELGKSGVTAEFVTVDADTRTCVNIVDGAGAKTEIVEAGNPLSIEDGTRLLDAFGLLLPRADFVAICGSYPPPTTGFHIDLLGDSTQRPALFDMHLTLLVKMARRAGKRVLVDSKGTAFEMAVRNAPPWCITPNVEEAETLLHMKIKDEQAERQAVLRMLGLGVEIVILTCGERGAWLGVADRNAIPTGGAVKLWFLHAPWVRTISVVGSGDSLVGAFLGKFHETGEPLQAARWGIAAGAANAGQLLPAYCTYDEIRALVPHVRIEEQAAN